MNIDRVFHINIQDAIERLFDDSSISSDGNQKAILIMGGVAAGKTTLRRKNYSTGYVLIDSAEIFHYLSGGDAMLDFPDALQEPLELIGCLVAEKAITERRHIVTEIIGSDVAATTLLIDALKSVGYYVEILAIECDLEESMRRNEARGDNISAYYAEPIHRNWIISACASVTNASGLTLLARAALTQDPEARSETRIESDNSPVPFEKVRTTEAFTQFITTSQECANEIEENARYVMHELQKVIISSESRQKAVEICESLGSSKNEILSDILIGNDATMNLQQLVERIDRIVNRLNENLNPLHRLVMTLRSESDGDSRFRSASLLIEESATNILQACSRASEAGDKLKACLQPNVRH